MKITKKLYETLERDFKIREDDNWDYFCINDMLLAGMTHIFELAERLELPEPPKETWHSPEWDEWKKMVERAAKKELRRLEPLVSCRGLLKRDPGLWAAFVHAFLEGGTSLENFERDCRSYPKHGFYLEKGDF